MRLRAQTFTICSLDNLENFGCLVWRYLFKFLRRNTAKCTTASHVTLSTISDTMITSADEAPPFTTLSTNYRIGGKLLPIRPSYTTLPCSCGGTKKDIAKPSSQKFVNCLMNTL
eukprot:sb/3476912/